MGLIETYFYDTYALIEITRGNPRYAKYTESNLLTSQFNIAEYIYSLLQEFGEQRAKIGYKKIKQCVIEIDEDVLIDAMKMKLKYKKMKLSYADCIGYCLALRENIKFLTGDEQFRNLTNVEFVKKE